MDKGNAKLVSILLVIVSIAIIYFLYFWNAVGVLVRGALALGLLAVVGIAIQNMLGLNGGYGFYMMGSRKGLSTINSISKRYRSFWESMALWGLTLGFGILAYPLVKGKIDKRIYAFGIISLIFIEVFVLPYVANAFQFINLPQLQNAIAASQAQPQSGISAISYVTTGVTIFAGFSGTIIASIFINAESILYSIVQYITNPMLGVVGSGISSQIPGVAPVIPGIDIPLFAGLISLAILLIIHEFSHGILSRISKVKLKSIGILLFGFIPVGGYVEPDEKQVNKLKKTEQTNIFAAGIGSNFLAMIVFFVLVIAFTFFVIPNAYQYGIFVTQTLPNYPANSVLQAGMRIIKWNNHTISNLTSLAIASAGEKPNSTVTVMTNTGTYNFRTVASPSNSSKGIIGVTLAYKPLLATPYSRIVYFLYTVFSLSLLLNFLVAIVNLLPIPGFDGYRIYTSNIKNRLAINVFGAFIIMMILVNVLPWFIR